MLGVIFFRKLQHLLHFLELKMASVASTTALTHLLSCVEVVCSSVSHYKCFKTAVLAQEGSQGYIGAKHRSCFLPFAAMKKKLIKALRAAMDINVI